MYENVTLAITLQHMKFLRPQCNIGRKKQHNFMLHAYTCKENYFRLTVSNFTFNMSVSFFYTIYTIYTINKN